MQMRRARTTMAVVVMTGAVLAAAAGCGTTDGDDTADAVGSTATTEAVTTEPADTEPADTEPADTEPADSEPDGTEPDDGDPADSDALCEAAEVAATALAPAASTQTYFRGIRDAWQGLADTLPEPHATSAATIVAAYDDAEPLWGDDDTQPSKEYLDALYGAMTPAIQDSFALAEYVADECGITLPGFD